MEFQTEYEFMLPKGYIDNAGNVHRKGVMLLATAADEIFPLNDARVRENPEYYKVLLLSRVIKNIGEVEAISPKIIERLFAADLEFLQTLYKCINASDPPMIGAICPACGKEFMHVINFSEITF